MIPQASTPLIDPFGRAITYLRVSVTDRRDFRCMYCMSEKMIFLPKKEILSLKELEFSLKIRLDHTQNTKGPAEWVERLVRVVPEALAKARKR